MARNGRCNKCFGPLSIDQDVCNYCGHHQDEEVEYSKDSVILERKEKLVRPEGVKERERLSEEEIDQLFEELEKRLKKEEEKIYKEKANAEKNYEKMTLDELIKSMSRRK